MELTHRYSLLHQIIPWIADKVGGGQRRDQDLESRNVDGPVLVNPSAQPTVLAKKPINPSLTLGGVSRRAIKKLASEHLFRLRDYFYGISSSYPIIRLCPWLYAM